MNQEIKKTEFTYILKIWISLMVMMFLLVVLSVVSLPFSFGYAAFVVILLQGFIIIRFFTDKYRRRELLNGMIHIVSTLICLWLILKFLIIK